MPNMSNVLGLIFANMHDKTINDLTKARTMASVPFGARYRLIDFVLSNLVNSGVQEVGVITKSNYQSLLDHLGSGREWDLSRKTGGLHLLPPFSHVGSGIYRGRLEALSGVLGFIKQSDAEYVVMADSDIITNMDFRPIIESHINTRAEITVVYGRNTFSLEQNRTKDIIYVNENKQVYDILHNPEISGECNVNLNIYVMNKKFLENLVEEAASRSLYSFEIDILQHKLHEIKIMGYKYDGYFSVIDSMKSFYKSNMEMMDFNVRSQLFPERAPIYTKVRDEAPAKYGLGANVKNSLIADGCIIEGDVENSILFRGVKVGKGAKIRNSIIMQGNIVGQKSEMNFAITDKDVTIGNYRSLSGTQSYPIFVGKYATV